MVKRKTRPRPSSSKKPEEFVMGKFNFVGSRNAELSHALARQFPPDPIGPGTKEGRIGYPSR